MKILFVSQFFWPEARTAPTNLGALAEDLAAKGHEIVVVTGVPNHPLGRVYDGYKMKLWQWEEARGYKILRLPLYPDHGQSVVGRLLNYGSFTLSAITLGVWLSRHFVADIMFAYYAPLTMGLTTYVLNRFRCIPLVYWVTDIWPENFRATGLQINDRTYGWLRKSEDWGYRQAEIICVDSPGYEHNLRQKGVPPEKIRVVAEWADENIFFMAKREPSLGAQYGLENKFNIMYGGNLGKVQHLETVIEAAELVQDLPNIQFVFIGDGTETDNLKQRANDLGLQNVRFIPRQPMQDMHLFFAWAGALLVHLDDTPIFRMQLPSKVLAYMACGRPLLCAVPGTVEQVVKDANSGVCCPSVDPEAMAQQVRILYAMDPEEREVMGRRGRQTYLAKYSRSQQVRKIEDILQKVVAPNVKSM